MKKNKQDQRKFIDSDGDGLSDYDEVHYFGSDPHDADSDSDGIEDGEAVLMGRDPVGGGKLKDFFIPHKGNNYHPKSLHPKRVLFHALAALAVKGVVLLLVFFYPLSAWMTLDVAAGEAKKVIALTNELRDSLSLPVLKESARLDQAAIDKVEDMFLDQYFAHTSPKGIDLSYWLKQANYKGYVVAGENLAMGYENAVEVVAAWKKSPTHYANLIDENFSEIGVGMTGGIFKNQETVLTAQYFGLPEVSTAVGQLDFKKWSQADTSGEKMVLAEKTTSVPKIDQKNIKVTVDKPAGKKEEKVVKVEAVLPETINSASVRVLDRDIPLSPQSDNKWQGEELIASATPTIIVPSVLTVTSQDGQVVKTDIPAENLQAQRTSLFGQYLLFKNYPNHSLAEVFNLSAIYFKIILILSLSSFILAVFIEIRKQRARLIFSGLGLIAILLILIIF